MNLKHFFLLKQKEIPYKNMNLTIRYTNRVVESFCKNKNFKNKLLKIVDKYNPNDRYDINDFNNVIFILLYHTPLEIALIEGFNWKHTSEGFNFWDTLYKSTPPKNYWQKINISKEPILKLKI